MSTERDQELIKRYIAALEDKGLDEPACPICGCTTWRVEGEYALVAAEGGVVNVDRPRGTMMIGCLCTNCGFARLHAMDLLLGKDDD